MDLNSIGRTKRLTRLQVNESAEILLSVSLSRGRKLGPVSRFEGWCRLAANSKTFTRSSSGSCRRLKHITSCESRKNVVVEDSHADSSLAVCLADVSFKSSYFNIILRR